jgi:hypothetical protein
MRISLAASMTAALASAGLCAIPAEARAGADIYVCVDADGRKTYQNTGAGKGCTRLDVPQSLIVPAPRQPQRQAATAEARPISPASFPRVDAQTQRVRDTDRRRILEDELGTEEARLASLRAEFNGGAPQRLASERSDASYQERLARLQADLQRSENNVASLKRELALLARQ